MAPYAELHCHTNFSFLDGASAPDELIDRAVELGLSGLAVTDHQGLYGAVRFTTAAEAVGIHPVIGVEIELLDAIVPDPNQIAVPARRPARRSGRRRAASETADGSVSRRSPGRGSRSRRPSSTTRATIGRSRPSCRS